MPPLSDQTSDQISDQISDQLSNPTRPLQAQWLREFTAFDSAKIDLWVGVRNTIGSSLALALGFAVAGPAAGLVCGLGALTVSYTDGHDPYFPRMRRLMAANALSSAAVFAGAFAVEDRLLAASVATLWAFMAGLLIVVGTTASDLTLFSLAMFLVFAAQPLPLPEAAAYAGMAFAGGLLQTAISVASWPLRRGSPERREISALYAELAAAVVAPSVSKEAPVASLAITRAQLMLSATGRRGSQAERYRSLLSQAERIRVRAVSLARLRRRSFDPATVDEFLQAISSALLAISHALNRESAPELHTPGSYKDFDSLARRPALSVEGQSAFEAAVERDVRRQMTALAGQARTALGLALATAPAVRAQRASLDSQRRWTLRFRGSLAMLRANLTLRSAACRHALRLAVAVAIGEALAAVLKFPRTYWVPMTIALVLKPEYGATLNRGVLRAAGTIAGLLFATFVFWILPESTWTSAALGVVFLFLMRWMGGANYGLLAFALSGLVVALFALTGVPPHEVVFSRGVNTVIGGAVALVVYLLWPTRERWQSGEVLAQSLDAYRVYFRAVVDACTKIEVDDAEAHLLDRARLAGRVARSNLQASEARLRSEPGATEEQRAFMAVSLTASNRFAHASMALEAMVGAVLSEADRAGLREFAPVAERTLTLLSGLLRGRDAKASEFPDLRVAYQSAFAEPALVRPDDSASLREEADRVVNSLNTLRERIRSALAARLLEVRAPPNIP